MPKHEADEVFFDNPSDIFCENATSHCTVEAFGGRSKPLPYK